MAISDYEIFFFDSIEIRGWKQENQGSLHHALVSVPLFTGSHQTINLFVTPRDRFFSIRPALHLNTRG
jgi:hypothetical protein